MADREMTLEDHQRALAQQRDRPRLECEQIIQRANSINKDLINRIEQSEIGKFSICGYDFQKKQLWVLIPLILLFVLSSISACLIWFTSSFDDFVVSHLIISPSSENYENWATAEYKSHIKVHIFNYTNVDDFKAGRAKRLKVKDVGPYYYEEMKEKINIEFHNENGTVTYRERLNHRFVPRLSKGRQSDIVTVPNLLTFSAAKRTENSFFMQFTTSMALGSPFLKQPAHRFIWGYEDNTYDLMKGILRFQNQKMNENMGLLAARNGTLPYTVNVATGLKSMDNIGMVQKWDGNDFMDKWSTEECDSVKGSDGLQFPPYVIREKKPITIFTAEACRTYPYVFSKEVKVINNTVPVYKYVMPMSVYDSPDKHPENQCYCEMATGRCAPQGFVDISRCVFDTPLYISMPHFYNVEREYFRVDGLRPSRANAESHINVHAKLGFAVGGSYKFQVNVLARNLVGFTSMSMFKDDTMLPVAWFDVGLDEEVAIPPDGVAKIYRATFTPRNIELSLKYVSILVMVLSSAATVIITRSKWERKVHGCVDGSARSSIVA